MRRSCRPSEAFSLSRFVESGRLAARPGRLREHQDVERLALLRDVAARQLQRPRRIALDEQREHRLLATVKLLRIRPLVGQRDPLAHLGDVASGRRRIRIACRRSPDAAAPHRSVSRP